MPAPRPLLLLALGAVVAGTTAAAPVAESTLADADFPDPFVLRDGDAYYAFATGANGANVQAQRVGVWTLPKLTSDDVTAGAKLYWDNTNKRLTLTSSGNTLVGAATAAAGTSATTVSVLLDGAVR